MKRFFKIFFLSVFLLLAAAVGYFSTIKKLDNDVMGMKYLPHEAYKNKLPTLLPSAFVDGQRFYLKVALTTGDTALAFGDSGGGISMLAPTVVGKFGLQSLIKKGLLKGVMPVSYVQFADAVADKRIPPPVPLRSFVIRSPFSRVAASTLYVPSLDDEEVRFAIETMDFQMFLGQNFFMNHSWTFDYLKKEVWVNTDIPSSDAKKPNVEKIGVVGFPKEENMYGHASMYIEVDGELIEVLFDTGATLVLSDTGKKLLQTDKKTIAGSFIARSVFDKWRTKHPDWKYYPKTDMNSDVIEVPSITIAGNTIGPVLFAKRNDEVWANNMNGTMTKTVKGAIGGSALQYLKVTVDYQTYLAKFER